MAETNTSPANQSGVDTDASPVFQSGRPPSHLDNSEEDSTNVPESSQVKFNNVLKCNVLGYIGPKNEDGEYFQLCNIDAGKLQGASTRFKFLEQSAELQDYSINIQMINKEKEMSSTGTDGSQEAKQIDTEEEVQKNIDQFKQMLDDDDKKLTQTMSSSTDSSTSLDVAENLPITERSAKTEEALQGPASPDDTIGQTFCIKDAVKGMKEQIDTLEGNYQAAKTENESLKRDLEKEINHGRDQALLVRKIRASNDDLKKTKQDLDAKTTQLEQERERAQGERDRAQQDLDAKTTQLERARGERDRAQQDLDAQTRQLEQERERAQGERDRAQGERDRAQQDLDAQTTQLERAQGERDRAQQRERDREQAWQQESLCYQHWITELIHCYRSLKAYFRLKVYEDRTTGRPPRCIAITAKLRPCLRYAKEYQHHNRLCLQHYQMHYGDQQ